VIVASVCARGGSRGVPRKALREVGGKTLLSRAIGCAREARRVDRVVVSTDDPEIAEAAQAAGAEVPFLRPADLATDDAPKWEVFRHLVAQLNAAGSVVDVLVDLDVGTPLRLPSDVEACVESLLAGDDDLVTTAYPSERNPYFNMVQVDAAGLARVVVPLAGAVHNRQAAPRVYSLSPAVYAIRATCLGRVGHWSLARMRIQIVPRERAWDIDEELDLVVAEALLSQAPTRGGVA
jgi:CMP-N-acetylneuraminic acid synthetase